MKFWLLFLGKCFLFVSLSAQNLITEPVSVPLLSVQYGLNLSAADLNQRFGFHSGSGIGVGYKTLNNWQFEVKGQALFGQKVNCRSYRSNARI